MSPDLASGGSHNHLSQSRADASRDVMERISQESTVSPAATAATNTRGELRAISQRVERVLR